MMELTNNNMIKLKDIIIEAKKAPSIFIPRRVENRLERLISNFIKFNLNNPEAKLVISGMQLSKLPEILKDLEIKGSFHCFANELTSLENSPKSVGGNFGCAVNFLKTLEGGPEFVGGNYSCSSNKLHNLVGCPSVIGGSFNCNNNNLTSFEGGPKYVKGSFHCSYNSGLKSLNGLPLQIEGNFILEDNTSIDGEVRFTEEEIRKLSNIKGKVQLKAEI